MLGPLPLLFLILYINCPCHTPIAGRIISYADDTIITCSGRDGHTTRDATARVLKTVGDWHGGNLLALNTSKTKFIAFSSRKTEQPAFNSINLNQNPKCKVFGHCDRSAYSLG